MTKDTIEVSAAIIEKNGNVLAAQRGYGDFKGKWEFPGGKIKEGEDYEDALRREIKEELNADIDILDYLITINYEYPEFNLIMHTYICELLTDIKFMFHNPFELEHDNLVWLEQEDLDLMDWLPADIEVVKDYKRVRKA